MLGQQNQHQSQPNLKQAEQDPDLLQVVALTHDLMETPLGKKWLDAMERWFMIRVGVVNPQMQNWEGYAAFREGQNFMIRQLRQWTKEHKTALQVKAENANPEKPKAKRARGKK